MNLIRRLQAWWNSPPWSKWFTVGYQCGRCDFPFALRRVRGGEKQTTCANCDLWHDAPSRNPE